MALQPKVALSQDFLLQLSKLPNNIHTKVMQWACKFQSDPSSPGINYERILGAKDANLKSIRIDQNWRGIVFKPDKGDVYVLLYVDTHEAAYRWAERRKITVNPITGAMQVFVSTEVAVPEMQAQLQQYQPNNPANPAAVEPGHSQNLANTTHTNLTNPVSSNDQSSSPIALYEKFSDKELLSIGVPQEWLTEIKKIVSDQALDQLQNSLPLEAYEGLFLLAAGESIDQILYSRETRVDQTIDTNDFAAAISKPESQSRFVVVDDETMVAIMNAPLAQWRVFLHPTQNKLATGDKSGPYRVLGGAGTGKTVLAMHRAKWLAENRASNGKKVLFTTFTKNLATDIEENLKTLCSQATMEKIEVKNLDAWVHGQMRARRFEHRIVFNHQQEGAKQAWTLALANKDVAQDLSDEFYAQELEHVILAQGITTKEQYRIAKRTGRGVVLSRPKRDAVWPVFDEYRGQLATRKLKTVEDAYREIASLLKEEMQSPKYQAKYCAIVVDETQDFGPQALQLLRAIIAEGPNDLMFVGDGHQRIYSRHKAAMGKCGINIVGRSKKLYLNYRTTDEIRRQAVALLEGCEIDDLDDGHDETKRYKSLSHGPSPVVLQVSNLDEAIASAVDSVKNWQQESQDEYQNTICIMASSNATCESISKQLRLNDFKTQIIDAQQRNAPEPNSIQIATLHRAKGLEFDQVIIVCPQRFINSELDNDTNKKLLYVGLTRAKREAMLIGF